jgi:hypothetical protein
LLVIVRAFDATNVATELWDSTQNLARDDVGNYAKYNPPTIANGKAYIASLFGTAASLWLKSSGLPGNSVCPGGVRHSTINNGIGFRRLSRSANGW